MGNSNSRKVMIPASNDFDEQMSINKLITSKKPSPKDNQSSSVRATPVKTTVHKVKGTTASSPEKRRKRRHSPRK